MDDNAQMDAPLRVRHVMLANLRGYVADSLDTLWTFLSGERFLTGATRRSNGGGLVLVRALWVTVLVFALAVALTQWLDPDRTAEFSLDELRRAVGDRLEWLGAIFAGTYAAFYSRFSSQWTYLAGVYNQIKAAEAQAGLDSAKVIAEWKAGFIEDADDLHLVAKPIFASIIWNWGKLPEVKAAFARHTTGADARWQLILADAKRSCDRQEARRVASYSKAT